MRLVYPIADPDVLADRVFRRAATQLADGDEHTSPAWLFGIARTVLRELHPEETWWKDNAAATVAGLRSSGAAMRDWHAWTELDRLASAIARLAIPDQMILRLTTTESPDGDDLALILGIPSADAMAEQSRVLAAFRTIYDEPAPSAAGGLR